MDIIFAGAEFSHHRDILIDAGATRLGFSASTIRKLQSSYAIPELPTSVVSYLMPGKDYSSYESYWNFAQEPWDFVFEFDTPDPELRMKSRAELSSSHGDNLVRIWRKSDGEDSLFQLLESFPHVALSDVPSDRFLAKNRSMLEDAILLTSDQKVLKKIPAGSFTCSSWTAPMQYGDLFEWDGRKLFRHRKNSAEEARERLGIGSQEEALAFGVASWITFASSLGHIPALDKPVTRPVPEPLPAITDLFPEPVARLTETGQGMEVTRRKTLPVVDYGPAGIKVRSKSLRVCDSCMLSERCPGYEPSASCAYDIPIEVSTPQQEKAAYEAIVAMQLQRVMMLKMQEDLQGFTSEDLTREMKLAGHLLKLKSDRERIGFTAGGVGFSIPGGIMQSLFSGMTDAPPPPPPVAVSQIIDVPGLDFSVREDIEEADVVEEPETSPETYPQPQEEDE